MGKAPADQFYWNDWIGDVELQSCCSATRGIWMNALCRMWFAKPRGQLCMSHEKYPYFLNCKPEEFEVFLKEAQTSAFCQASRNSNGNLTLTNRRMHRDEKSKEAHRLRQQRYYDKHKPDAKSDGDVTIPSSSSSSSPTSNKDNIVATQEFRLSDYLWKHIVKRHPKHKKPKLENWAKTVDLMIRVDKRDPEEIKKVIEWCQQDEFWQNNILSTAKLRKQYDQLVLKMKPKDQEYITAAPKPREMEAEEFTDDQRKSNIKRLKGIAQDFLKGKAINPIIGE